MALTHPPEELKLKRVTIPRVGAGAEQTDASTLLAGMLNGTTALGKVLAGSYKIVIPYPVTQQLHSKKNESIYSQKDSFKNVC